MENQLIMFPSITYAMKARDLLMKYHIKSYIERTPMSAKTTSCGYSLYVSSNIEQAEKILSDNNIKSLGRVNRDAK